MCACACVCVCSVWAADIYEIFNEECCYVECTVDCGCRFVPTTPASATSTCSYIICSPLQSFCGSQCYSGPKVRFLVNLDFSVIVVPNCSEIKSLKAKNTRNCSNLCVSAWNSLPSVVVESKYVASFKNNYLKVDLHSRLIKLLDVLCLMHICIC